MTPPSEGPPDGTPEAPPAAPPAASTPPEAEAPPEDEPGSGPSVPSAAQVVSACREARPVGCDAVYIRVQKSAPDLCVQLVLDNCNENSRVGLRVRTPFSWKLSSGSASANTTCTLTEYDPDSEPALEGSGDISWLEEGSSISAVQFAVQLQLSPEPDSAVPALVAVSTEEALDSITECE